MLPFISKSPGRARSGGAGAATTLRRWRAGSARCRSPSGAAMCWRTRRCRQAALCLLVAGGRMGWSRRPPAASLAARVVCHVLLSSAPRVSRPLAPRARSWRACPRPRRGWPSHSSTSRACRRVRGGWRHAGLAGRLSPLSGPACNHRGYGTMPMPPPRTALINCRRRASTWAGLIKSRHHATPHPEPIRELQEAGIDMGGLMKEFLESVTAAGFDPNRGLFAATPDGAAYPHPLAGAWPGRCRLSGSGGRASVWFRWRRRAGPHSHSIPPTRSHRALTPARPTAPADPVQRAWTAGWLRWRHWAACWGGRCTRGCCWRRRWHPSLWRDCRWVVWCGACLTPLVLQAASSVRRQCCCTPNAHHACCHRSHARP